MSSRLATPGSKFVPVFGIAAPVPKTEQSGGIDDRQLGRECRIDPQQRRLREAVRQDVHDLRYQQGTDRAVTFQL